MAEVLVLGATGDQGAPLLRRLLARGHGVRAATRDPLSFPGGFAGVQPIAADFHDIAALGDAMAGMDAVLMHLPFTFDRAFARLMGRNIAAAATTARVGKLVFHTSCYVAPADLGIDAHDARRDIEAALEASGLPFVFIRSPVFMDNLVRLWAKPSIVEHGVFAYPCAPALRISWTALDDVAAWMVAALESPTLTAHRLTVGGPEALTGDEVAARLTTALGRPVRFQSLRPNAFAAAISALATGSRHYEPGSFYDRMAKLYHWYNAQEPSVLAVDLASARALLDVAPTSFADWAARQDWSG